MATATLVNNTNNPVLQPKRMSAVSLSTYLSRHFSTKLDMARHFGITSQQIKRWLQSDCVVVSDSVYLLKSNFFETEHELLTRRTLLSSNVQNVNKDVSCYELDAHISMEYAGNETAFAQANGSTQQQVFRWVNLAQCIYLCGQVYRHQFSLITKR